MKQRKILTVILAILMIVTSIPFSVSASNETVCERIEVTTFDELKAALEVTSNQANPPERLVVMKNKIIYKGDGYIEVSYPGKLALDVNGKNLEVTNSAADDSGALFYLGGESKTQFTLTNTSSTAGSIIFRSDVSQSALLRSDNPNASVNVLSVNQKLILKTELQKSTSTNTNLHFTLCFKNIDKVYISGAKIWNSTKNPSNIFFNDVPNEATITGNTALTVNNASSLVSNAPAANLQINTKIDNPTKLNLTFGGCTIMASTKSNNVNYLKSFDNLNTYVYSNIVKHTGDEQPDYVTIYAGKNGNVAQSDWNGTITPTDQIKFEFKCCSNIETADLTEEDTIAGHIKKCNKCTAVVSITSHNFDPSNSRSVEPTCTTPGSSSSCKCTDCNYMTASELIPALGHTEVTVAGKSPTCTQTGLTEGKQCSVCGEFTVKQQVIPMKEHKNDITLDAVAATCTQKGLTQGKKCSVCGTVTVQQTEVPAKGHTEVVDVRREPTCTETGLTEGKHCSVCGAVLVKQEIIPAKGHTEVETVPAVASTCTENGSTAEKKCSVCGQITAKKETVPPLGHNVNKSEWVIDVSPNCTDKGSKSHHCTRCDYKEDVTEMPSLNTHIYNDYWTVDKEATCTQDGVESRHCTRCGAKVDERTIPSKGGHNIVTDEAVAATCTTDGLTAGSHCSVCGEVIVAQKKIAAHHTEAVDKAVAATCTKSGLTEGKHCTVCGEVTVKQNVISATGHKSVTVPAVAATCTSAGKTAGTKCSACGTVIKAQTTVAAKGHSYKATVTKATLSANGSTVTKCTTCGYQKSKVAISKINAVTLSKTSLVYNGKVQKPTVTVKDSSGKALKSGTDYSVAYSSGCKNVGQYTVTVTFKGNYSGTKKLTFNIIPKGTTVSKLTSGSQQITVKWKKQATQTTGYEIQYSLKSNMKSSKKVTVAKTGTTSTTIKKLKSGKTYYVRIRTYKTVKVSGKNVKLYSAWSSVKNIKVK